MLNAVKIKLRTMLISFKPKPKPTFVNPYAPIVPVSTSKINPYVTDFGVVKKKSVGELILERVSKKRESGDGIRETEYHTIPTPKEPTFLDDMNEMFIGDVMMVASKFKVHNKKKEKVMTSIEIQRACENTKW